MFAKVYLTIVAIVGILYGLALLLVPAKLCTLFGLYTDATGYLAIRFFGSALLAWGLILWVARDFKDWTAIRGVLIGTVVGDVAGLLVNNWGLMHGLMHSLAWANTILYVLLLVGGTYLLRAGPRKLA